MSVARSFCVIRIAIIIVGVYSARFASGCVQLAIKNFCHIMRMLIWCCRGEVM